MAYWTSPTKQARRGKPQLSPKPEPVSFKTLSPTRSSSTSMSESESAAILTAQHLRDSGWRDLLIATEAEEEPTFCTCRAHEDTFDPEEVVKCLNRGCKIELFHLTCMDLPEHPPRGIGWNCPTCRMVSAQDVCRETGLYDQRHHDDGNAWRIWMRSEGRTVKGGGKKREKKNAELRSPMKKCRVMKEYVSPEESESPPKETESKNTISEEVSPTLKRNRGAEEEEEKVSPSPEVEVEVEAPSSSELTELEFDDDSENE